MRIIQAQVDDGAKRRIKYLSERTSQKYIMFSRNLRLSIFTMRIRYA